MILSLDPGTEQTAWMLFDEKPIEWGFEDNADVLAKFYKHLGTAVLAYEWIECMGMAVGKETFETVWWLGRYHECWVRLQGTEPHRVTRRECKLHLCGSVRAKDANIRQALIDLYGGSKEKAIGRKKSPGPLYGVSSHCWSALAVARTFCDTRGVA